jgi:thiol-disulfide isomerase/thioredoxin
VAASLTAHRTGRLVFGLAVLLLSACSLQQPLTEANQGQALVGHPAPDWVGTDLDGHRIALRDFRGYRVFLNFWASWCGPCRAEQPGLNRIATDYQARGLRLVGVDIRDSQDQARIFRNEFKMPYPSVFDQAAHLGYAYQIDAPPSSVFIDAKGILVFKITGGLGEENYRRIIEDKLFHNPAPNASP